MKKWYHAPTGTLREQATAPMRTLQPRSASTNATGGISDTLPLSSPAFHGGLLALIGVEQLGPIPDTSNLSRSFFRM